MLDVDTPRTLDEKLRAGRRKDRMAFLGCVGIFVSVLGIFGLVLWMLATK